VHCDHYYVVRKIKLHYDAKKNPYGYLWVAKGNDPLVLMGCRLGPNAYNLDNPGYFPKVGIYKWDQNGVQRQQGQYGQRECMYSGQLILRGMSRFLIRTHYFYCYGQYSSSIKIKF
jgi:hypothetical protein